MEFMGDCRSRGEGRAPGRNQLFLDLQPFRRTLWRETSYVLFDQKLSVYLAGEVYESDEFLSLRVLMIFPVLQQRLAGDYSSDIPGR
jgi:hypothetical protein